MAHELETRRSRALVKWSPATIVAGAIEVVPPDLGRPEWVSFQSKPGSAARFLADYFFPATISFAAIVGVPSLLEQQRLEGINLRNPGYVRETARSTPTSGKLQRFF